MERASDRSGRPNTPQGVHTRVVRDDSGIRSTPVGVALTAATSKRVILLFGKDHPEDTGERECREKNHERLVLSPLVAERIAMRVSEVFPDDESKYGPLGAGASVSVGLEAASLPCKTRFLPKVVGNG